MRIFSKDSGTIFFILFVIILLFGGVSFILRMLTLKSTQNINEKFNQKALEIANFDSKKEADSKDPVIFAIEINGNNPVKFKYFIPYFKTENADYYKKLTEILEDFINTIDGKELSIEEIESKNLYSYIENFRKTLNNSDINNVIEDCKINEGKNQSILERMSRLFRKNSFDSYNKALLEFRTNLEGNFEFFQKNIVDKGIFKYFWIIGSKNKVGFLYFTKSKANNNVILNLRLSNINKYLPSEFNNKIFAKILNERIKKYIE